MEHFLNKKFCFRSVLPSVQPGYLGELIPREPPQTGESWKEVLEDVDRLIMPGITHWQSPKFHAYYPTGHSFPAVVGEMLSAGFGCVGLSWVSLQNLRCFPVDSTDTLYYCTKSRVYKHLGVTIILNSMK